MDNKKSFWNVLTQYKIEIPKIQRDYAQGRTDEKTKTLVNIFLADIRKALNEDVPINLDFVYGKVTDSTLIPIDGQQRLTTLFLLHWYFAVKENKLSEEVKGVLRKFTYETRLSSRDFCAGLVEHGGDYQNLFDNKGTNDIQSAIIDSAWYFLSWKYDPTIVSMLNMIDTIHSIFAGLPNHIFEKLISDSAPITFYFLPMEDFKLTDELYIKMNARGKQLTNFENFKTLFSEYFNIENKAKLDNEWLDIFWKIEVKNAEKDKGELYTHNVDRFYYRFLQNMTALFYTENNAAQKDYIDNYPLFKEYKAVYDQNEYIQQIVSILNALITYHDNENLLRKFISDNPNYWERIRFYALARYFIWQQNNSSTNQAEKEYVYQCWMRITKNLINNTPIEGPEDYKKAIESIKELSIHIAAMYEYVSKSGNQISFFAGIQKDEEMLKAQLILKDAKWLPLLERIENHLYFDGQIGFMLAYARDKKGEYSQKDFERYANKLEKLFSAEFQENHNFLFQRALLSKGNYLIQPDWHHSFCNFDTSLRAKRDNWRKVFNDPKRTLIIKTLLDDITSDDILDELNRIIKTSNINDWRKLIIDNGENIAYCKNRYLSFDSDKVYLISKMRMSSRHRELFSYGLYLNFFKGHDYPPFSSVWYYESTSYDESCAVLDGFIYAAYTFYMDIQHTGKKNYTIIFGNKKDSGIPDEVINLLKDLNFTTDSTYGELSNIPEAKVAETVKKICTSLQQLS